MAETKKGKELEAFFARQEQKKKIYAMEKARLERKQDSLEARRKLGLVKRKPLNVRFGKVSRLRG